MAWGTSGGQDYKCPDCRAEWWDEYTSWFFDPHEDRVTSESQEPARAEHHDAGCRFDNGVRLDGVV